MYNYSVSSIDLDNDTIRYHFIWGDQTSYVTESGFLPNGSIFTTNHSWIAAGKYRIIVTASDNKTISETSELIVFIDAVCVEDIGYLVDIDGDGIYDSFYNDTTDHVTDVDFFEGNYLIDDNGDGDWNYVFDPLFNFTSFYIQSKNESKLEISAIWNALIIGTTLSIIVLIIIFFGYKQIGKKTIKSKRKSSKKSKKSYNKKRKK
jgi:hypothetical protein